MDFLTSDDFKLIPYRLPDLTGTDGAAFTFNKYAQKSIEEILRDVLGHEMYEEFSDAMELEPYLVEERWSKLMDGELYQYNGKTYKWYGMKECLRPYVFCMWTRHNVKQRGRNGYSTPKVENANAETTDGIYEMVTAYNEFGRMVGSRCNYRDSLYGYLKTKTAPFSTSPAFTNWCWKDPGFMNEFDL